MLITRLAELRGTVAGLPKIQKKLTDAKRKTVAALDQLVAEIELEINLASSAQASMEKIRLDLDCPEH